MSIKNSKLYKDVADHPGKWALIVLLSLFLISMLLLIILGVSSNLDEKGFGREIGKTLLQIISVGIIGTLLSLLLARYNKHQEKLLREQQSKKEAELQKQKDDRDTQLLNEKYAREGILQLQQRLNYESSKKLELQRTYRENKNQFMKNILRELNDIYKGTKSARRMLRAKSFKVSYETALKDDSAVIDVSVYDFYLDKINNYQLGLATILNSIATDTKLFKNHKNKRCD